MWFHILLSALIFNGAFLYADKIGFLIFGFPLPLMGLFFRNLPQNSYIKAGWWWGIGIFGVHFYWLFDVLMKHSQAACWLCALCYILVVCYFCCTSAVWLWMTALLLSVLRQQFRINHWCHRLLTIFICVLTMLCYWLFLEYWALVPLGFGIGYPFINPVLPLTSYRSFLTLLALCSSWYLGPVDGTLVTMPALSIGYVPPVINRVKNTHAAWGCSSQIVGQKIFHELTRINNQQHYDFLVAPESMFAFPLNECPLVMKLWMSAVPDKGHLFLGSILKEGLHSFQAVFWLHKSLIIKVYVKKILMPFVEKTPRAWRTLLPHLKNSFLSIDHEFSDQDELITSIKVANTFEINENENVQIIPCICLEFFLLTRAYFKKYEKPNKRSIVFFFANDSWFCAFFRTILYNLTILKAHVIGIPIVYIGHFGCHLITPE